MALVFWYCICLCLLRREMNGVPRQQAQFLCFPRFRKCIRRLEATMVFCLQTAGETCAFGGPCSDESSSIVWELKIQMVYLERSCCSLLLHLSSYLHSRKPRQPRKQGMQGRFQMWVNPLKLVVRVVIYQHGAPNLTAA